MVPLWIRADPVHQNRANMRVLGVHCLRVASRSKVHGFVALSRFDSSAVRCSVWRTRLRQMTCHMHCQNVMTRHSTCLHHKHWALICTQASIDDHSADKLTMHAAHGRRRADTRQCCQSPPEASNACQEEQGDHRVPGCSAWQPGPVNAGAHYDQCNSRPALAAFKHGVHLCAADVAYACVGLYHLERPASLATNRCLCHGACHMAARLQTAPDYVHYIASP